MKEELGQAFATVEWPNAEKIRSDVAEALQRAFQQTDEALKNQPPKPGAQRCRVRAGDP